tara:strand:+ start:138 stop:422 length:285 start_codon:yes stop_codon:yes gene_type:complete
MSTLHRSLEAVQTEIRELLGISTLQTASNLETESYMREIEKNIADLKGAVYKSLYKAYGHSNKPASTAVVKSEEKQDDKKKSKGFRLPRFGKPR